MGKSVRRWTTQRGASRQPREKTADQLRTPGNHLSVYDGTERAVTVRSAHTGTFVCPAMAPTGKSTVQERLQQPVERPPQRLEESLPFRRKPAPVLEAAKTLTRAPMHTSPHIHTYQGVGNEVQGLVVSRFGLILKKDQKDKWRLIQDLSHPEGRSINDGIDRDLCSLTYVTVDRAVEQIIKLGRGTLMAKVDIKQAYRNIPIHPEDRHLLGMQFDGQVYLDTTLPFGLRSAPKIFTALADALEWILRRQGVEWLMHYLDDYLTLGAPGSHECAQNLNIITDCCNHLGVPLKQEQLEGPTMCLEFLGIILDTRNMEIRLSEERVGVLATLLKQWQNRKRCRKRQLLSLIGKLAHACKVVRVGRIFLRRLINLSTSYIIGCTYQRRHRLTWLGG